MKNTLVDLNNYLFEQLEVLSDESLSNDELETAITRSKAISRIANSIVDNARLALEVEKVQCNFGYDERQRKMPVMLTKGRDSNG